MIIITPKHTKALSIIPNLSEMWSQLRFPNVPNLLLLVWKSIDGRCCSCWRFCTRGCSGLKVHTHPTHVCTGLSFCTCSNLCSLIFLVRAFSMVWAHLAKIQFLVETQDSYFIRLIWLYYFNCFLCWDHWQLLFVLGPLFGFPNVEFCFILLLLACTKHNGFGCRSRQCWCLGSFCGSERWTMWNPQCRSWQVWCLLCDRLM